VYLNCKLMEEELYRDVFAQCLIQWVPGFCIMTLQTADKKHNYITVTVF